MSDITDTLVERGKRYGRFEDNAAIAQDFKFRMRQCRHWERKPADVKQALDVIVDKISRILGGDHDYIDNWVDIQGYAKLISDRLQAGMG
jgi:hypothetical protein